MNIKQTKRIEGMNTNEEEKKDGGEETKLKRIERQIESFNYYSLVRTSYLTEGQVVVNVRYVCVCVCVRNLHMASESRLLGHHTNMLLWSFSL